MSHPKRADHFKEWSKMMLEQALVPDRLQYKSTGRQTPSGPAVKRKGRLSLAAHRRRRRKARRRKAARKE